MSMAEMISYKIYFGDLKKDAQKKLLNFYGAKNKGELEWDYIPIILLP